MHTLTRIISVFIYYLESVDIFRLYTHQLNVTSQKVRASMGLGDDISPKSAMICNDFFSEQNNTTMIKEG